MSEPAQVAVWFLLACLSAGLFKFVVVPWAVGRISTYEYHQYLQSPEWAAVVARLSATRRGKRCAACSGTSDLNVHHVFYVNLGFESLWQLVRLCDRHHRMVHTASEWIFSSRTRGLWATTALVCGYGKLKRAGRRRPRRTPSPTATRPGSFAHGDVMLGPDGRIMQRTGKDWQDIT
jgi:hypothetical protein